MNQALVEVVANAERKVHIRIPMVAIGKQIHNQCKFHKDVEWDVVEVDHDAQGRAYAEVQIVHEVSIAAMVEKTSANAKVQGHPKCFWRRENDWVPEVVDVQVEGVVIPVATIVTVEAQSKIECGVLAEVVLSRQARGHAKHDAKAELLVCLKRL